jgi:hypothetical protein
MFGDQDGAPEIDRGFEVEFRRRDIGDFPVGRADNGGAVDHDVERSSTTAGGDRFESGDEVHILRDIDNLSVKGSSGSGEPGDGRTNAGLVQVKDGHLRPLVRETASDRLADAVGPACEYGGLILKSFRTHGR